MARATTKRPVRCYLCGQQMVVSQRTMSTTCSGCHKAIKVEDIVVKSYVPVIDLQTCGKIRIAKRGRISAKRIQCGDGIICDGAMQGTVESDGDVRLGPKASWKGKSLQSRSLAIADGATLLGVVSVPWQRPEPAPPKNSVRKKLKKKLKKTTAKGKPR